MNEPHVKAVAEKELDLLESEWKEARSSIARFDGISVDLRKFGFSLITFMITASSIALGIATLHSPFPMLIVPFSIMLSICALFLADRYNEVLLLACVVRARQIEDTSQELLEKHLAAAAYSRVNLTTYLEDSVQRAKARIFSLSIYFLFIVVCFCLGLFSLISYYQEKREAPAYEYFAVLLAFTLVVVFFLLLANRSVSNLMRTIKRTVLIDGRILIKIVFSEKEVSERISALAHEINYAYQNHPHIKMLTVDKGGAYFGKRLQDELKKLGGVNIESLPAYSERKEDGVIERINIQDAHRLRGKEVLIVDDLAASGRTIKRLDKICRENDASDVRICVLLDAPKKRKETGIRIDFAGLNTSETEYLVGCGMDFHSECRELKYIGVIQSYKPKQF